MEEEKPTESVDVGSKPISPGLSAEEVTARMTEATRKLNEANKRLEENNARIEASTAKLEKERVSATLAGRSEAGVVAQKEEMSDKEYAEKAMAGEVPER